MENSLNSLVSNEKFTSRIKKMSLEKLLGVKKFLDDRYYNDQQAISDEKYDIIVDIIKEKSPSYVPKVGSAIRDDDNKAKLPFKLNSMDKIKHGETKKLEKWLLTNTATEYVISDKLNGVSCLICYNEKGDVSMFTRGDGEVGSNISHFKDLFVGIPKGVRSLNVRGELIIKKDVFDSLYSKEYKNSLGMIVSVVNAKTFKQATSDIRFVAYEVVTHGNTENNQKDSLSRLLSHGFEVVSHIVTNSIDDNVLSKYLGERTEHSEYSIDGIIVQKNTVYNRTSVESSGNPSYAFAYKMITDSCETRVVDVIWTASRHSILKPRVQIEPVELCGATINFATGNNAKFIVDNKINKGSRVVVIRSGEIIPKIERVLTHGDVPLLPQIPYKWNDTKVDIFTESESDNAIIKQIAYFFSTLEFKNIAEGVVTKLYNAGFDDIFKILKMSVADFRKVPTFEEKMSSRLFSSIQDRIQNPVDIPTLMIASGAFGQGLGIRKMKTLLDVIPNLLEATVSIEDICKVDGFSTKTAEKVASNIKNFNMFFEQFKKCGGSCEEVCKDACEETCEEVCEEVCEDETTPFTEEEVKMARAMSGKSKRLSGMKVVFTGFRNTDIERKIESFGGEVCDSVTKTTSCLVTLDGDNHQSSGKSVKAKKYGIQITCLSDFIKQYLG